LIYNNLKSWFHDILKTQSVKLICIICRVGIRGNEIKDSLATESLHSQPVNIYQKWLLTIIKWLYSYWMEIRLGQGCILQSSWYQHLS
jgi:hypothetical protein